MRIDHSSMKTPHVKAVFLALENQARFVGGCVRNVLINKPIFDIDIATPLIPNRVTKLLEKKNIKVIPTGILHGTVTAIVENQSFEITTLRKDKSCDGRYADVEYTDSWQEDAARRDFTFNAMSCDISGELFDYFGGLDDLKQGRVKFVGDALARCNEDYLRVLRYLRFFAYYGREPVDKDSLEACQASADGVALLSGERVASELMKIFSATRVADALILMQKARVLSHVFGEEVNFKIDILKRYLTLEKKIDCTLDPMQRLAMTLRTSSHSNSLAKYVIQRWKLSNIQRKRLLFFIDPGFVLSQNMSQQEQKKILRQTGANDFCSLVAMQWSLDQRSGNYQSQQLEDNYGSMLELARSWEIPTFPVTGKDLIKLGINPGKTIGEWLKKAEDFWEIDNYQPTKAHLLQWIKQQIN